MSDSSQQVAAGSYIAQSDRGGTTIIGFTAEQVQGLVEISTSALREAHRAELDRLAGSLKASRQAVVGFLKILKEEEGLPERLPEKLALIAQRHVGMMERLASLDPEDAEAQQFIQDARDTLEHAASAVDYDRADELLSKAEDAQSACRRRLEARAQEYLEAAKRVRQAEAATRGERGELSLTRLDYIQAAQHFRAAADLIWVDDASLKLYYLLRSARALYSHGDEKGDNAALRQAIGLYREVLAEQSREQLPLDWASTQNNLGNALRTLGERESGTERLAEAVSAYRAALEERTREQVPLEWAMTQNNLGTALQRLGERESGTERLEEAVVAYRAALEEYTRERVPLDWAMTQNNLGNALSTLGGRQSGTERLEEAVTAYRAALEEYTRERVPLNWATTQNNLGNALRTLGERESGTERLEEALTAIEGSWEVSREAGMRQYDEYFESRLREIRELISKRRQVHNQ
jgi:tetratricopeptide (TPR) repeat protein